MKYPYDNMNMQMMLDQGTVAALGDKILLNDNIDHYIDLNAPDNRKYLGTSNKLSSFTVIQFCLAGTMDQKLNLQRYHLCKNDVMIVRSGQIGELSELTADAKLIVIACSNDFFYHFDEVADATRLRQLLMTHPYCHLTDREMEENVALYHFIKRHITEGGSYTEVIVRSYLQALIYNIYSSIIKEDAETVKPHVRISRQQELFNRFIEVVQDHYQQERNIQYYADLLCITPKYLSQVIYKVSGHYAGDYIEGFVILEAKALIKSRNYSMLQISEMLHFASQSFFGRYFKKATGFTPLQFQDEG